MNYHSNTWIESKLAEHLQESKEYFTQEQIVGLFYQGSGNYGLDTENSDVDTKLVVVPSFKDISLNKKPVSTTHIRANEEHIDFKDVRLMLQTFRKQNINFIEILFTPYKWLSPLYKEEWMKLMRNREKIARYNPYAAVKTMKGMALEKFHAMEHEYPSKIEIIKRFGYDPKQLHHLMRLHIFLNKYIENTSYENCLRPDDSIADYLKLVKSGIYSLDKARDLAKSSIDYIIKIVDEYCTSIENKGNPEIEELLEDVQYNIMKIAVKKELEEKCHF